MLNTTNGFTMSGLNPNQYKFIFDKIPVTNFFAQNIALPDMILGTVEQDNRFPNIKLPGEKITYNDLVVEFFIDSEMKNYYEIYNWMKKLSVEGYKTETISNCSLLVGNYEFSFYDVWPVSLSNLSFFNNDSTVQEATAQVTFSINYFELTKRI